MSFCLALQALLMLKLRYHFWKFLFLGNKKLWDFLNIRSLHSLNHFKFVFFHLTFGCVMRKRSVSVIRIDRRSWIVSKNRCWFAFFLSLIHLKMRNKLNLWLLIVSICQAFQLVSLKSFRKHFFIVTFCL
jgi:hypothetical protein